MAHSIFALEVCAPYQAGSPLHTGLRELVRNHPKSAGLQQKWQVYQRVSQLLVANIGTFEKGCWDYFDEDQKAQDDFKMWCNGMLTEEGSRKEPSGAPDPYRGEARYLTFTVSVLLIHDTPTERQLRERCRIPEEHLWRRDVFQHLIEGLPFINFASVKGDVLYLIPRDDDWGLTPSDLTAEKFKYLRQIT
jgi:hypothetical protein